MANELGKNGFLQQGEKMHINDKFYSKNRLFYLVLQDDGNLVVYHNVETVHAAWSSGLGEWKDGYLKSKGFYSSNIMGSKTEYWKKRAEESFWKPQFFVLQGDGNSCVYSENEEYCNWDTHDHSPSDRKNSYVSFNLELTDFGQLIVRRAEKDMGEKVWTKVNEPRSVKELKINKFEYHLDSPKKHIGDFRVVPGSDEVVHIDNLKNKGGGKYTYSYTEKNTTENSWDNEFSFGMTQEISAEVSGEAGVPLLAKAKVKVAVKLGFSEKWTWKKGGKTVSGKEIKREVSFDIDKGTDFNGLVQLKRGKVEIPYTMYGDITFADGVIHKNISIPGKYSGVVNSTEATFSSLEKSVIA